MIRRSINPKRPKQGEDITNLQKSLGAVDPDLIPALLDGMNEADMLAQATLEAPPTPQLLQDGTGVVLRAYAAWNKLTPDGRSKLRGCTAQLFSVMVEELRKLQQLHADHIRRLAEQEQARERHENLLVDARHLCAQSKAVLLKVAGNRPGTQAALEQGVGDPVNAQDLLRSLRYLGDTSRNLLALPASSVRSRALLFGLNKSFVDAIESAHEQIRQAEQKLNQRPSQMPKEISLDRSRAIFWFLLRHLSEVFAMARAADPSIPDLRLPSDTIQAVAVRHTPPAGNAPRVVVIPPVKAISIEKIRVPTVK